jgi:hypothetical protein
MTKKKQTRSKHDVGLEHVEAALEMVVQDLADIRWIITEMRRQQRLRLRVSDPDPGLPCKRDPGKPCMRDPGKPCMKKDTKRFSKLYA